MTDERGWRTSSFCAAGECVEVGQHGKRILVRDKADRKGGVLKFTPEQWQRFGSSLKGRTA